MDTLLCIASGEEVRPAAPLITWNTVEKKMPWGIILLFGGGFALAAGSDSSKLSEWIGDQGSILRNSIWGEKVGPNFYPQFLEKFSLKNSRKLCTYLKDFN
jgi:hypothetical protein